MSNIGRKLGYCGGVFGRLRFGPYRVEAEGWDWVVVRGAHGEASFCQWSSAEDKQREIDECDYGNEPHYGDES